MVGKQCDDPLPVSITDTGIHPLPTKGEVAPALIHSSTVLLLLARRRSHQSKSTSIHPSIMSEDHPLESVGTATAARKRSRAPSSDEDPGRTKLSRLSSSPPASGISASTAQEESVSKAASEQHDRDVGVAHSSSATKPPKPLLIHIINKKIPSSQLAHLKGIAKKKDFPLSTTIT